MVKIADSKIAQLKEAAKQVSINEEAAESTVTPTEQMDITAIKLALNSSNANASTLRGANILGKITKLPDSAEKHYLKAVANLRIDSSIGGCRNALDDIMRAIQADSTNTAYIGLLQAIEYEIDIYEERHTRAAEEAEQERLAREHRSQAAVNAARRRRFWGTAGPCIGGIVLIGACIWSISCCCKDCC